MRNKGIGCDCHVVISCAISEEISVTIRCRDLRDGASDTEKTMTFKEKAKKLFPKDYGDDLMRAWRQIEGWLFCMGVNDACHAYVIGNILKCSELQFSHPFSLQLDVNVEIIDVFSYLSKQLRLHSREEEEEDEFVRVQMNKRLRSQELQV